MRNNLNHKKLANIFFYQFIKTTAKNQLFSEITNFDQENTDKCLDLP